MLDVFRIVLSLISALSAPAERTAQEDYWVRQTTYWVNFSRRCYIPVCHLRVASKPDPKYLYSVFEDHPAISAEDINKIVDSTEVPYWLLADLNKGYDLLNLSPGQHILIPAVGERTFRRCIDPVRISSLHHVRYE